MSALPFFGHGQTVGQIELNLGHFGQNTVHKGHKT